MLCLLFSFVIDPSCLIRMPQQSPALATQRVLFKSKETRAQLPVVMSLMSAAFLISSYTAFSTSQNASLIDLWMDYLLLADAELVLSCSASTSGRLLFTQFDTKSPPCPSKTPKQYPDGLLSFMTLTLSQMGSLAGNCSTKIGSVGFSVEKLYLLDLQSGDNIAPAAKDLGIALVKKLIIKIINQEYNRGQRRENRSQLMKARGLEYHWLSV